MQFLPSAIEFDSLGSLCAMGSSSGQVHVYDIDVCITQEYSDSIQARKTLTLNWDDQDSVAALMSTVKSHLGYRTFQTKNPIIFFARHSATWTTISYSLRTVGFFDTYGFFFWGLLFVA